MKLAVRKDEGSIPGGGFHYMLMPKMDSDAQAEIWAMMGHLIIEVDEETGNRLLTEAGKALTHQVEVAILAEKQNPSKP